MKRFWWLALLMWWLGGAYAFGHDLGVMTLRFEELEKGRYQLTYVAKPGSPESHGTPVLPEGFGWEQEPELPQGFMRLVFSPDGRALHADDEIILPWKRNGVLVEAFWRNGETVRRFCPLEEEGIVMRIGDLRVGGSDLTESAKRFVGLGARHLFAGLDHLLCLVGLLMISRVGKGAATFGAGLMISFVGVLLIGKAPAEGIIDTLAALTLVIVAAQCFRRSRSEWTGWTGLVFGGVHGMGFAAALLELGLPRVELAMTGGFFLLGGVLAIAAVAVVFAGIRWALGTVNLRMPKLLAIFPRYAFGILGAFWFFERGLLWFS